MSTSTRFRFLKLLQRNLLSLRKISGAMPVQHILLTQKRLVQSFAMPNVDICTIRCPMKRRDASRLPNRSVALRNGCPSIVRISGWCPDAFADQLREARPDPAESGGRMSRVWRVPPTCLEAHRWPLLVLGIGLPGDQWKKFAASSIGWYVRGRWGIRPANQSLDAEA